MIHSAAWSAFVAKVDADVAIVFVDEVVDRAIVFLHTAIEGDQLRYDIHPVERGAPSDDEVIQAIRNLYDGLHTAPVFVFKRGKQ